MSKLFLFRDSLNNKISYFHLMLLMASLPFDMFYSHLILVSFIVHTLIHFDKKPIKPVLQVRTLALQSMFFITLLSTIYTINPRDAFNEWGKEIVVFIFPLLFCFNRATIKKYRTQLLLAFSLVCTATIIYLYLHAFVVIKHYQLPVTTLLSTAFINHNFSEPIGMHATFFSMQVTLALVCFLTILVKERQFSRRLFYTICSFILLAGLIQLCSKTIFIVLIIVINIAVPYFLLRGRGRRKFILASATVSAIAFAGILTSDTFRSRYVTAVIDDFSNVQVNKTTDTRLARWKVAIDLVKGSPVIGYGAGSEHDLLHERFFDKKMYSSFVNNLNAHSQYLSFLIKSGAIGLLFYLATLVFGFRFSFRKGDFLFFTFMLLVAFVSFSETLFEVDKGTFFYALFFSFFIFSHERRIVGDKRKNTFTQANAIGINIAGQYKLQDSHGSG